MMGRERLFCAIFRKGLRCRNCSHYWFSLLQLSSFHLSKLIRQTNFHGMKSDSKFTARANAVWLDMQSNLDISIKISSELKGQKRKAYRNGYNSAVKTPVPCDDIQLETLLIYLTSYEENGLTENPLTSELSTRLQNNTTSRPQDLEDYSDAAICHLSVDGEGNWERARSLAKFVSEAKQRGLSCGVKPTSNQQALGNDSGVAGLPNEMEVPIFEDYRRVTIRVGASLFETVIGVNYLRTASGARSRGVLIFGGDFCETEVFASNQIKFLCDVLQGI